MFLFILSNLCYTNYDQIDKQNSAFFSGTTKDVLITSTYVHMKSQSKFAKYASDLSTVCPRILLSGPAGMNETLDKYCLLILFLIYFH